MTSPLSPYLSQNIQSLEDDLRKQYIGRPVASLPTPSAIVDLAIVRRNCASMLQTVQSLNIQFRAHIKTHKTIQCTQLQVGESGPVRLIVSTVVELEFLVPWLKQCVSAGREVSVLYGVPVGPSALRRLKSVADELGSAARIALMVDNAETLDAIARCFGGAAGQEPVPVYLKIDTGYGRAGLKPEATALRDGICSKLREERVQKAIRLLGLYSHLGHSYSFSTPEESLQGLLLEFETLQRTADTFFPGETLTLSVGATPTATAAELLAKPPSSPDTTDIQKRWQALKSFPHTLEIHAGVYPFLDLQQIATHARPSTSLDESHIALRILVEVASTYTDGERSQPEALIAAGTLALGREPCKSYPGWGVVTPWSSAIPGRAGEFYGETHKQGWIVGRISQEHGILTWSGDAEKVRKLCLGEKLMVWPNHACVAGAGFGWYFVVDGELEGEEGKRVVDVWARCRGW